MEPRAPGNEFDGYRLVRLIGRGEMGEVHLARDTLLDRDVAIKFITGVDSQARERFVLEARAIARLQHPNVVTVHRVGEVEGCPYLVSEYAAGEPLSSLRSPIPEARVLRIASGLSGALAAAHQRGVVHRDIKPANVILDERDEAKLLDFGIAKLLESPTDGETPEATASPRPDQLAAAVSDNGATPDATASVTVHEQLADVTDPSLTRTGVALGTPLYMAPEIWLGAPASFSSDVYSLGAVLYNLCSGNPPFIADTIEELRSKVLGEGYLPLSETNAKVSPEFATIIDRCLCRNPADRYSTGNAVRSALAELILQRKSEAPIEGNPYRGLSTFEANHRDLFFGRDSEIKMVLERLAADPFVLVVGDSGVGKSSLCRAGVIPRIDRWLAQERRWSVATIVPGRHPIAAFSSALAPFLDAPEEEIAKIIADDPVELGRRLRARQGTSAGAVLFIDQFEEIVTLAEPLERVSIARALQWLCVPAPGIRILATARSDFLSRLANLASLGDEISRALYFLRPLSAERVRDTILGPARVKGINFESEALVEELVESTVDSQGGLPLLQFALAGLWNAREKNTISHTALDEFGGVAGALGRHADAVLDRMMPAERTAAQRIMIDLVTSNGTRARKTGPELGVNDRAAAMAVEKLIGGRLVMARQDSGDAAYELAHEALITGWATLARWLSAKADVKLTRERLGAAIVNWERLGRAREALWGAKQLREIRRIDRADLLPGEIAFIKASRRANLKSRALWVTLILSIPLLAIGSYFWFLTTARAERSAQVDREISAANVALEKARKLNAEATQLRHRALALFDQPDLEAAESLWSRYLDVAGRLSPAYGMAGQRLETALLVDPQRKATKDRLADALYERALLAEELGTKSDLGELMQRLSLYDGDGSRRARWHEPGQVVFTINPVGAALKLYRYKIGPKQRYVMEIIETSSQVTKRRQLAAGSYLAELSAPGCNTTRLPFTVSRGEQASFSVALPRADDVPTGFVYVPEGRFLFGSSADDDQRRDFFYTVPLHERETDAYLIALHETTFAQWFEYLAALPKAERETRIPQVGKGGFQGALALRELTGGRWQMIFQPSGKLYTVISGEKLCYPARTLRREQDWLRFPVFGVTAADAAAYAKWLDRTGKIPGARLCTELEWERTARGADGREFPHGERLYRDDANFDDTYSKDPLAMGPDEVGSHPVSRSPFLVDDMAGNVWEWTVSVLEKEGYAARGGSYYYGRNTSRTPERAVTEPSFRDASVGLRICADPPPR